MNFYLILESEESERDGDSVEDDNVAMFLSCRMIFLRFLYCFFPVFKNRSTNLSMY